jgi:hypothetical protein
MDASATLLVTFNIQQGQDQAFLLANAFSIPDFE